MKQPDLGDPATGILLPLAATRPIGTGDRCDARGFLSDAKGRPRPGTCGCQGLVRAWIPGIDLPLYFCGHHFRRHEPMLMAAGAYVHDER